MKLSIDVQLKRTAFTLQVAAELTSPATGVVGRSGAGKSSLLHLIAGLERPDSGRILLDGAVLDDLSASKHMPPHRRRVGMVFQDDRLFPHYTARGNLMYGHRSGAIAPRISSDHVIDLLALEPLLDRPIRQLSGGERQRVALGRTLLSEPSLLLLDEPLRSLDEIHQRQFLTFLRRITHELSMPMLYVSHDLAEILQLTDQLLVLSAGRVVGQGPLAELVNRSATLAAVHDLGLMTVLDLAVTRRAADASLVELQGSGGFTLRVPSYAVPAGATRVTIGIRPQDIALADRRIEGISIQNQLPARVTHCAVHAERVIVELDAGNRLLAEVTSSAVKALSIIPGRECWCLVKTSALLMLNSDEGTIPGRTESFRPTPR